MIAFRKSVLHSPRTMSLLTDPSTRQFTQTEEVERLHFPSVLNKDRSTVLWIAPDDASCPNPDVSDVPGLGLREHARRKPLVRR